MALLSFKLGLSLKGIYKHGEVDLGTVTIPGVDIIALIAQGEQQSIQNTATPRSPLWSDSFRDGIEILFSLRGIGWDYGTSTNIYVPPDHRDISNRNRFIRQTMKSALVSLIVADFFDIIMKLIPDVGDQEGGSIFAFGSNSMEQYVFSTCISVLTVCQALPGTYISTTMIFSCCQTVFTVV